MLDINYMTQVSLPNYRELDFALAQNELKLHPSELHGLFCGILSGNLDSKVTWETLVPDATKEVLEAHPILETLYTTSAQQLDAFLFEFQLLLPPDADDLPVRAEALTLWCQGFLTGLKLVHIQIVDREQSEITEAINDLVEIAKMNYEEVVSSEEDEAAYVELVEYIRMAVILIYQDLRSDRTTSTKMSSSLHLH